MIKKACQMTGRPVSICTPLHSECYRIAPRQSETGTLQQQQADILALTFFISTQR